MVVVVVAAPVAFVGVPVALVVIKVGSCWSTVGGSSCFVLHIWWLGRSQFVVGGGSVVVVVAVVVAVAVAVVVAAVVAVAVVVVVVVVAVSWE